MVLSPLNRKCKVAATELEEIELDPAVETIGARAFASCAALKTVRVPAGAETDESAFADCSADLQIITE